MDEHNTLRAASLTDPLFSDKLRMHSSILSSMVVFPSPPPTPLTCEVMEEMVVDELKEHSEPHIEEVSEDVSDEVSWLVFRRIKSLCWERCPPFWARLDLLFAIAGNCASQTRLCLSLHSPLSTLLSPLYSGT